MHVTHFTSHGVQALLGMSANVPAGQVAKHTPLNRRFGELQDKQFVIEVHDLQKFFASHGSQVYVFILATLFEGQAETHAMVTTPAEFLSEFVNIPAIQEVQLVEDAVQVLQGAEQA